MKSPPQPLRVLILEDDPLDAQLTVDTLKSGEMFSPTPTFASDEPTYRNELTSCSFDIILADYNLPEYDGLRALQLAHEICPNTPFIFVSGTLGEEIATESLKRGATDYVMKQKIAFRLNPCVARALRESEERKRRQLAEFELRQAKQAAENANSDKDKFLAMLSHELRTPLNPIVMSVDYLLKRKDFDDFSREALQIIKRNLTIEVKLIDDLLDLSKAVVGSLKFDLSHNSFGSSVIHAVEIVGQRARAKEVKIESRVDPNLMGYFDHVRVTQVFTNILNNAVRHSRQGGTVYIEGRREGAMVAIEVRDDGDGFPPEDAARLFEAFSQNLSNGHKGELGVGLTISKRIVEGHGGFITAKSNGPGTGCTMSVYMPTPVN